MQPGLEEQNDDTDLGHRPEHGIGGIHDPEHRTAKKHPGDQLPEHGGLAKALRQLTEDFRRDEDGDERGEQRRDGIYGAGRWRRRDEHYCAASPSRYVYPSSPAT